MLDVKAVIFMPVAWKDLACFTFKKHNICNASPITKRLVFLINFACALFDVFIGGWVGGSRE